MRRLAATAGAALVCACGADPIEVPKLPDLPPVSSPATPPAATASSTTPTELGDEALVLQMSSCLRRSAFALDDAWERLRLDVDPATGRPHKERKDIQPFVPSVESALVPCVAVPEAPTNPELRAAWTLYGPYRETTTAIAAKLGELSRHFDERTYEGDDWAFSQATVVPLATTVATWEQQAQSLRTALQPVRVATLTTRFTKAEAEAPDAPATIAVAMMLQSERFAICTQGDDLSRCGATQAAIEELAERLDTTLGSMPEGERPQFWARALASAGRSFADRIGQVEASMRRGHLGAAQRRDLEGSRIRLEKAADTVRRGLGPPTPG